MDEPHALTHQERLAVAIAANPDNPILAGFGRLNDLYRALGRYLFVFSKLQLWMRLVIAGRLARPGEDVAISIVLAEVTAYPLRNAYFALCRELGDLDEDEQKVGRELFVKMPDFIEQRNDFQHGDWNPTMFDSESRPIGGMLVRTKPSRMRTGIVGTESYSAADIDEITDRLRAFGNDVVEFGALALGVLREGKPEGLRVRDVFLVKRSRVVTREGARSAEASADYFPQ